jgi:hypothetical protein
VGGMMRLESASQTGFVALFFGICLSPHQGKLAGLQNRAVENRGRQKHGQVCGSDWAAVSTGGEGRSRYAELALRTPANSRSMQRGMSG